MREEDIKKMIKDSADHVTIPESLEPEQMMEKLRKMEADKAEAPGKQKKTKIFRYWQYGTVAAAALAAVSLLTINRGSIPSTGTAKTQAVQATEAVPGNEEAEVTSAAPGLITTDSEEAEHYRAKSYDEIYDRFQVLREEQEAQYYNGSRGTGGSFWGGLFGGSSGDEMAAETMEAAVEEAMQAAPAAGAGMLEGSASISKEAANADMGTTTGSYSETNIQVEGVDEGDVVKTDGTYIYAASGDLGTIRIIRPDGTQMIKEGEIPDTSTVGSSRRIEEFYLNGDRMTVIRSSYEEENGDQPEKRTAYSGLYMPGKAVTRIETYDLSNPKSPELSGIIVQDGYYKSSRRSGDYVYVFTSHESDVYADRKEVEKYIPKVNGTVIPADCIYIPENIDAYSYLVVSSVDMREPKETVQTKAVAASGQQYYVSGKHIYITSSRYDSRANQYDYTELMKLSYRDGRIGFTAHGKVNGYLNNQFSMDEYEGNLRLVSTLSRSNGKTTNSLYVLDEKLEKIGEIEDLAPDEQIYSARFMGDIGYFVTFRNMDPLFSVDLSDPSQPKILGELKITGFSEYLHPYMDGLLLGIGREINPDTTNFEGLKLSMFDISNPKAVKEVQKIVEEHYQYSTAWDNHKSVLISPSRNLIGFTVENYDYDKREWNVAYTVYSYDKQDGFRQELSAELDSGADYSMTRGLYIDEWLYVVENNRINAFSLEDFSHGSKLQY